MSEFVRFAALGLATGGAYAMLSLGLVVIYRSTGVVNFAHAAVAVSSGYIYFELSSDGTNPILAAILGIVAGLLLGLLLYAVTVLPLRGSSALTKGMATLAALVVIQSIITMRYSSEPKSPRSFLPQQRLQILGTTVTWDMLAMIILSTGLMLVLGAVYGRTKFGFATTAVAENEFVFATLGGSGSLVMVANWAIGGALAGTAGVLVAPIVGLNPSLATVLLIPGLAVALCGQFSSFMLTFVGALAIGVLQAELSYYGTFGSLSEVTGLSQAAPFLVIIALLVIFGRSLPTRGFVAAELPRIGSGQISRPWIGFWALLAVLGVAVLPTDWVIPLTTSFIAAILLLSVVVVTGYAGQLSLAQVSIAGVGVFVASILVAKADWPMPLAAMVGIAATAPISFLVGLPALRTRGIMLAVVTLGLAEALNATFFTRQDVNQLGQGLEVGVARFFGIDFSEILEPRRYALLALLILTLLVVGISNMRRSNIGKLLVAVRANERASAALGISVSGAKLYAFVLAGGLAGTAGILAAWRLPYVLFNSSYGPFASVSAAVNATLGGIGYISGAIFGGLAGDPGSLGGSLASELGFGEWFFVIMASFLLVNIVLNPHGVVPSMLEIGKALAGKVRFPAQLVALGRRASVGQSVDEQLPLFDKTVLETTFQTVMRRSCWRSAISAWSSVRRLFWTASIWIVAVARWSASSGPMVLARRRSSTLLLGLCLPRAGSPSMAPTSSRNRRTSVAAPVSHVRSSLLSSSRS